MYIQLIPGPSLPNKITSHDRIHTKTEKLMDVWLIKIPFQFISQTFSSIFLIIAFYRVQKQNVMFHF